MPETVYYGTLKDEYDMSKDKSESKRKRGRPVKYTMPEPLDATPEEVAKALMRTPPKKPHEWKFMQDFEGDTQGLEG